MAIELKTPLGSAAARALRAGDMCLLTGELYTARDAAHKRLCALLEAGQPLPFDIRGAVIYFVGPTPAKPGQAIGSAGPTTSYRMDTYSPALLRQGLTGMIGKGKRGGHRGDPRLRRRLFRRDRRLRRAPAPVHQKSGGHRLSRPRPGGRAAAVCREFPRDGHHRQRGQ